MMRKYKVVFFQYLILLPILFFFFLDPNLSYAADTISDPSVVQPGDKSGNIVNSLRDFAKNKGNQMDAASILRNVSKELAPWQTLIQAFCYLMGISLFFKALYHLKVYGESRAMMSKDTSLKTPLTWMFIGAAFIYFPTTVGIMLNSAYGEGTQILMYSDWNQGQSSPYSRSTITAIFDIIKFMGLLSFIRGLIILTKVAQPGSHQVTFGKGIVHILAGIMAMNIVLTVNIFSNSIGVQ